MKKWWSLIFTVAIIFLLIWVLKDINFYEVYLLIVQANLIWFALAIITSASTFVVWNFRSMYIIRPYVKVDFWFYMKVLLAGAFFNTVTPGAGVGGEPFRAHFISSKYKKPHSKVLGYILGDTFFRMAALFIFIIFSVLFVLVYVQIPSTLKLILEIVLFLVLVGIGSTIFLLFKRLKLNIGAWFRKLHRFKFFRERFETEDHFVQYINKRVDSFSGVFRKVVRNKNNLLVGLSLSFLFWILNFLTAYFLFLSFGYPVNFLSVIIVFTLGNIIGSLSPVPGGIGVVESIMTLLYSAMGILPSLALLAAFLQRIIYYFFSLFVGGWSLINLRRKFNNGKLNLF